MIKKIIKKKVIKKNKKNKKNSVKQTLVNKSKKK